MEKAKIYNGVIFSADVMKEAIDVWLSKIALRERSALESTLRMRRGDESWVFDSDEECFAHYRAGFSHSYLRKFSVKRSLDVDAWQGNKSYTDVSVRAPSRREIEFVFEVFEKHVSDCMRSTDTVSRPTRSEPELTMQ